MGSPCQGGLLLADATPQQLRQGNRATIAREGDRVTGCGVATVRWGSRYANGLVLLEGVWLLAPDEPRVAHIEAHHPHVPLLRRGVKSQGEDLTRNKGTCNKGSEGDAMGDGVVVAVLGGAVEPTLRVFDQEVATRQCMQIGLPLLTHHRPILGHTPNSAPRSPLPAVPCPSLSQWYAVEAACGVTCSCCASISAR